MKGNDIFPKDKFISLAAFEGIEKEIALKVLSSASTALNNWKTTSTDFLTPPEYIGFEKIFRNVLDLKCTSWGGFEEAERRILFFAHSDVDISDFLENEIVALEIGGKFLFDMADHRDFLGSIIGTGIDRRKIGDIIVQGERGAQVMAHTDVSDYLCSNLISVRSVKTTVAVIPPQEIKVSNTTKKQISSSEASLRLDAVGSAGIGISRSKLVDYIKVGSVLINWKEAKNSSLEVKAGDIITIRGKGRVEIVEITQTKKGRYKIIMNRIS